MIRISRINHKCGRIVGRCNNTVILIVLLVALIYLPIFRCRKSNLNPGMSSCLYPNYCQLLLERNHFPMPTACVLWDRTLRQSSILLLVAVCYTNDMEDLVLLCERIDCGSLYMHLYQKVSLQLATLFSVCRPVSSD